MTDELAVTGLIGTEVSHHTTGYGKAVERFRIVSTRRIMDQATGNWVDTDVNWYSVVAFGTLAQNILDSLTKGDRILVRGRLKISNWDNGKNSGTDVQIEAKSIGHDLLFGTSDFEKRSPVIPREDDEDEVDIDLERELQPA
jgi:single-strand DNA-binding protein